MHPHNRDIRGAAIAAVIAIVGTITLFFIDFDPPREIQRNGVGEITAAAAQRAHATILPSEPVTRKASFASN